MSIEKIGFKKERIILLILILLFILSLLIISINKKGEALRVTGQTFQTGIVSVNVLENPPTCSDGIQNQNETGVDCGGPCLACPVNAGGGGGGGAAAQQRISLKIMVPSITTVGKIGKNNFNVDLENDGDVDFDDISIEGYVIGDSKLLGTPVTFNPNFITSLEKNKNESTVVTFFIESPEIFIYEVVINVTSKTPEYNTYNKVFITFFEENITNIQKIIAFTESLINENAECIELKDMLEDAKEELAAGNIEMAGKKAQTAMEACKRTIEGLEKPQVSTPKEDNTVRYIVIATISAVLLGILFNIYRQIRFRGWKNFFGGKNKR